MLLEEPLYLIFYYITLTQQEYSFKSRKTKHPLKNNITKISPISVKTNLAYLKKKVHLLNAWTLFV